MTNNEFIKKYNINIDDIVYMHIKENKIEISTMICQYILYKNIFHKKYIIYTYLNIYTGHGCEFDIENNKFNWMGKSLK